MCEAIPLDPVELFLLWPAHTDPPAVLDLPRPGPTPAERAGHAAEASAALAARGLGGVDRPAPALAALLRTLTGGQVTLELRTPGADGFGAAGDQDAAVALRDGERIRLAASTPGTLAAALLDRLPPLPAAPGLPVTVTVGDYATACRAGDAGGAPAFTHALLAAGLREADATTLTRAVTTRTGGGQIGATVGRTRVPGPVTWIDTPAGRYALRRDGDWVSLTPATVARLTAMTTALTGNRPGVTPRPGRRANRVDTGDPAGGRLLGPARTGRR